ncbi:hypothetical protein ACFSTI_02250 [Rhizorhabdus histidinilytica]
MARLFQRIDLVELLLMAFGAAERPPLRQRIDAPDGRELLVMPAISDRFAGVKILTITPENAGTGRPRSRASSPCSTWRRACRSRRSMPTR